MSRVPLQWFYQCYLRPLNPSERKIPDKQRLVMTFSGKMWTGIPQVACGLTSRSPDEAARSSIFHHERRLRSRRRLELGGLGREATAS